MEYHPLMETLTTSWPQCWSGVGSFCGSLAATRFLDLGETWNARLVEDFSETLATATVLFLNGESHSFHDVSCKFMHVHFIYNNFYILHRWI